MGKSVLVIDTPETCLECMFCHEFNDGIEAYCYVTDDNEDKESMREIQCEDGYCQGKPDWCPLKELPGEIHNDSLYDEYEDGYDMGWNRLLELIVNR